MGRGELRGEGHSGSRAFWDAVIDFVSGSLGGVASVYTGQPLDTVKVKMQTFPHLYRGMVHCSKETWFKEGIIRGFYAGTTPALVANIAENSVLFAGYGACQKVMTFATGTQKVQDLTILSNATAGCMAAFFTAFALCPTELIKCRLQAMREMQNQAKTVPQTRVGPFGLTKQILKQEGIPGLFRGLTSTIAREMPGYFFFFGGYEGCRMFLAKDGQKKEEIGILALYNGLQPTVIRTIPASAALFLAYENSKKLLHHMAGF
ncbi:hypothetical protein B566_EDAN007994 [Ephemera danica]|nr:hypothetical protein B566_EDAN007994 [Ephemera danica]